MLCADYILLIAFSISELQSS